MGTANMAASARRVVPQPLGDVALTRIRHDIQTCRLAPGRRITERGLAAELGLGISAVRSALTRLDHEGLIITEPRKGYRVAPLTLKSVDELFSMWAILGPEIAARGLVAATDEQLSDALRMHARLASANAGDDAATEEAVLEAVDAAVELFTVLAEASDNRYLLSTHQRLVGELGRVWRMVIQVELNETGQRMIALGHIGELIADRDADSLAAFLRDHIGKSHDRVMRTLIRWPSVIGSEIAPLPPAL